MLISFNTLFLSLHYFFPGCKLHLKELVIGVPERSTTRMDTRVLILFSLVYNVHAEMFLCPREILLTGLKALFSVSNSGASQISTFRVPTPLMATFISRAESSRHTCDEAVGQKASKVNHAHLIPPLCSQLFIQHTASVI